MLQALKTKPKQTENLNFEVLSQTLRHDFYLMHTIDTTKHKNTQIELSILKYKHPKTKTNTKTKAKLLRYVRHLDSKSVHCYLDHITESTFSKGKHYVILEAF